MILDSAHESTIQNERNFNFLDPVLNPPNRNGIRKKLGNFIGQAAQLMDLSDLTPKLSYIFNSGSAILEK